MAEPRTIEAKYTLANDATSVSINGLGEITKDHIEGPHGSTFIKAIKQLDEQDKGNRFVKFIKQV